MIRAFRAWRVGGPDAPLVPLSNGGSWHAGVNTATCARGHRHAVPGFHCTCGFWAFRTPQLLCNHLVLPGYAVALGQVSMWGRVVEHELGYRSLHARIDWVTQVPAEEWSMPSWALPQHIQSRLQARRSRKLEPGTAGLVVIPFAETPFADLLAFRRGRPTDEGPTDLLCRLVPPLTPGPHPAAFAMLAQALSRLATPRSGSHWRAAVSV